MHDPTKRSLFEAHFQIGLYLKETFVPKAYLFFMDIQTDERRRKTSKTSSTDAKSKVASKKPTLGKTQINHTKSSVIKEETITPDVNGDIIKIPHSIEDDR